MNEFYGNTLENETFEKRRLDNSTLVGSIVSATIGATIRYNDGQYSFIKFARRSSANKNLLITHLQGVR